MWNGGGGRRYSSDEDEQSLRSRPIPAIEDQLQMEAVSALASFSQANFAAVPRTYPPQPYSDAQQYACQHQQPPPYRDEASGDSNSSRAGPYHQSAPASAAYHGEAPDAATARSSGTTSSSASYQQHGAPPLASAYKDENDDYHRPTNATTTAAWGGNYHQSPAYDVYGNGAAPLEGGHHREAVPKSAYPPARHHHLHRGGSGEATARGEEISGRSYPEVGARRPSSASYHHEEHQVGDPDGRARPYPSHPGDTYGGVPYRRLSNSTEHFTRTQPLYNDSETDGHRCPAQPEPYRPIADGEQHRPDQMLDSAIAEAPRIQRDHPPQSNAGAGEASERTGGMRSHPPAISVLARNNSESSSSLDQRQGMPMNSKDQRDGHRTTLPIQLHHKRSALESHDEDDDIEDVESEAEGDDDDDEEPVVDGTVRVPVLPPVRGKPEAAARALAAARLDADREEEAASAKASLLAAADADPPKKKGLKKSGTKQAPAKQPNIRNNALLPTSSPTSRPLTSNARREFLLGQTVPAIKDAEYANLKELMSQLCRVPLLSEFSRPVSILHPEVWKDIGVWHYILYSVVNETHMCLW